MTVLLLVSMVVVFLIIDYFVQQAEARQRVRTIKAQPVPLVPIPKPVKLGVPQGLFFSPGHTWAYVLPSGNVRVGVDDFTQKILGPAETIELRPIGEKVNKGEILFSIRKNAKKVSFVSPIEGEIAAVNEALLHDPSLMNKSPYATGWIYMVKPKNLVENLVGLKFAEQAVSWIQNEVIKFKEFIIGQNPQLQTVGATLPDGGELVENLLENADAYQWKMFEEAFLKM